MNTQRHVFAVSWVLGLFILTRLAFPQESAGLDAFQQRVNGVELDDQDIIDGIAKLARSAGLAVSVEHRLGETISAPSPQGQTLTAKVGPGTVSEVLNGLCTLDPTFTWARDGNTVNVLPSSLAGDTNYLLNRTIHELRFQGVGDAGDAVMKIVDQLPGTREQIAVMETGGSVSFARPLNMILQDVTLRQALDLIARQLGPTYGWQFTGARDFRIIVFHRGLLPNPSRRKQKHPIPPL